MGVFFGAAMASAEASRHGDGPPAALFGGIFVGIGLVLVLIFSTLSFLIFKVGRNLSRYQSHTFCMVVAGIICLWIPLGTILGIFTLIVLSRDSVKAIFNGGF